MVNVAFVAALATYSLGVFLTRRTTGPCHLQDAEYSRPINIDPLALNDQQHDSLFTSRTRLKSCVFLTHVVAARAVSQLRLEPLSNASRMAMSRSSFTFACRHSRHASGDTERRTRSYPLCTAVRLVVCRLFGVGRPCKHTTEGGRINMCKIYFTTVVA